MYIFNRKLNYENAFKIMFVIALLFVINNLVVTQMLIHNSSSYEKEISKYHKDNIKLENENFKINNQLNELRNDYNALITEKGK